MKVLFLLLALATGCFAEVQERQVEFWGRSLETTPVCFDTLFDVETDIEVSWMSNSHIIRFYGWGNCDVADYPTQIDSVYEIEASGLNYNTYTLFPTEVREYVTIYDSEYDYYGAIRLDSVHWDQTPFTINATFFLQDNHSSDFSNATSLSPYQVYKDKKVTTKIISSGRLDIDLVGTESFKIFDSLGRLVYETNQITVDALSSGKYYVTRNGLEYQKFIVIR